jgi:hypothetical protein
MLGEWKGVRLLVLDEWQFHTLQRPVIGQVLILP